MNKIKNYSGENRYKNAEGLCAFMGLGRTTAVKFAREHGAEKRIGKRCIYDTKKIIEALDRQGIS